MKYNLAPIYWPKKEAICNGHAATYILCVIWVEKCCSKHPSSVMTKRAKNLGTIKTNNEIIMLLLVPTHTRRAFSNSMRVLIE
jgi:hypothetical protein